MTSAQTLCRASAVSVSSWSTSVTPSYWANAAAKELLGLGLVGDDHRRLGEEDQPRNGVQGGDPNGVPVEQSGAVAIEEGDGVGERHHVFTVRRSPARSSAASAMRKLTAALISPVAQVRDLSDVVPVVRLPVGGVGPVRWSMYVSMSRLRVEVDRSDELVAAFRGRAGLVESHDGFVDLQVWRSDRDPSEVLMVSRWDDRDAFKAYMKSLDHKMSHARLDPSLRAAIDLERLEHLHTYEVVAE